MTTASPGARPGIRFGGLRPSRSRADPARNMGGTVDFPVDREPPKETPPETKGYGNYCIRTRVPMLDRSGHQVADITGRHTSPDIIRHTEAVCETRKDGKKGEMCADAIVTFTKYTRDCETPTVEIKRFPPSK